MIDYNKLTDGEIDALIAERVMGWETKVSISGSLNYDLGNSCYRYAPSFAPSTRWQDMQLVVERMIELGQDTVAMNRIIVVESWITKAVWEAYFGENAYAFADTLPRAICEAALSALEEANEK